MLRLCIVSACLLALVQGTSYGLITFPSVMYVKPGDDFALTCKTDHGASSRIFLPEEMLPPPNALVEMADRFIEAAERTVVINEYEDASEEDEGTYSCLVHHGPGIDPEYSIATCNVIVQDLCESANCDEATGESCIPDYEAGTTECSCQFDCTFDFEPVCADTCELMFNECQMEEQICMDKVLRTVMNDGFCPTIVEPTLRHINANGEDMQIQAEEGELVNLASGLVNDGTPEAAIEWLFFPANGGDAQKIEGWRETYVFNADEASQGVYQAKITHCRNEEKSLINRYSLIVNAPVEEVTTQGEEVDNIVSGAYHVCTAYPGGFIENFNAEAVYFDLACTHVLASDVLNGGDYSNPWFIYGTFDDDKGTTTLSALTFYYGAEAFEVQRGWIVAVNGEKLILEEDVAQEVGTSGCFIVFQHLHVVVDCPAFWAYYDGIMAGHIRMKNGPVVDAIVKGRGNFGLCFDNNSGYRVNWQVGRTEDECQLPAEATLPCSDDYGVNCTSLYSSSLMPGVEWASCGGGAVSSCQDYSCEGAQPPAYVECSNERAQRVACATKYGEGLEGDDAACPDPCAWVDIVLDSGCPQKNPPVLQEC